MSAILGQLIQTTPTMITNLPQSRPPPSSPSLTALLELIPPSPILTPSDLSTSITSGEIPILLFEVSCSTTATPYHQQLEKQNTFSEPRTWEFNLSRSTLLIANHGSNGISFDVSSGASDVRLTTPCATFDMFGCPVHRGTSRRLSLCWSSNTAAGNFTRDGEGYDGRSLRVSHSHETIPCEASWITASDWGYAESSAALSEDDRGTEKLLETNLSYTAHLSSYMMPSQRDPCLDEAQSEDHNLMLTSSFGSNLDLSSPKQGIPSSTAQGTDLISSRELLSLVHPNDIDDSCSGEISPIEFCTGETSSVRGVTTTGSTSSLTRRHAIHRACYSPTYRKEFHIPNLTGDMPSSRPQIQNMQATARQGDAVSKECGIGSASGDSADSYFSVAVHKLPSPSQSPFTPPILQLPQPLSPETCTERRNTIPRGTHQHRSPWLQNTTISLVIDQEGFRTVQPVFKQSGFARRCLPDSGSVEVEVVTFVPTVRQNFRFHYAPWDGLPMLRRLLVNGDESRDFLSRQAYLSLKSSGVYTVHGTEIASPAITALGSPNEMAQAQALSLSSTKLYWQFDYTVEDRRAEQTGKIMGGEKIFVPLKFTCSPHLLHPNQGKKIKFMQIVKKTVVPKLTAEKQLANTYQSLRVPCSVPPAPTVTMNISPTLKTNVAHHATQLYLAKSEAWNHHRRSQSNPRESPQAALSSLPKFGYSPTRQPESASTTNQGIIPIRRRRASSAGESHIKHRRGFSPIRRVLPSSRLRQLVVEEEGTRCDEQAQAVPPPIRYIATETPLPSNQVLVSENQIIRRRFF